MANAKHLALIVKSVSDWNEWKSKNPHITTDLSGANLKRTNLTGANLTGANLRDANLYGASLIEADLNKANLTGANLIGADLAGSYPRAAILTKANLSGANLAGANLNRTNLSHANLSNGELTHTNFTQANLTGANLAQANLIGANLLETNLKRANLKRANLMTANLQRVQALGADFTAAILTGACIKDWNINGDTKLNEVDCLYVYLQINEKDRFPANRDFTLGEFTSVFQKALSTIDLIFHDGVNWEAFALSFKNIEVKHENANLDVQSIEKKLNGILVVKVSVSPNADKTQLHNKFMLGYQFAHQALEGQYQARLEDKDKHINQLFYSLNQAQEHLGEVSKQMAEAPKYDQRNSTFGNFVDTAQNGSRQQSINYQYNYAPEQKQTLADAAAEIQQYWTQLQTQGYSPKDAQQKVASDLARQAQNNHIVKERLVK